MKYRVEFEREEDGRWIGEVRRVPGALACGSTRSEAMAAVRALVLRIIADRLEHGDAGTAP